MECVRVYPFLSRILQRCLSWPRAVLWLLALVLLASGKMGAGVVFAAPKSKVILYWLKEDPNSTKTLSHGMWDKLLKRYVKTHPSRINRVDYRGFLRGGRSTLARYLKAMQSLSPTTYNRDEQQAYWINLYNAAVLRVVLDNYPLETIRKAKEPNLTKGPWESKILEIEGRPVSLDDIEHRVLRPIWQDPRVHYALTSASLGSPGLLPTAYTSRNISQLLRLSAIAFINHPRGVQIRGGNLYVSSVYHWYLKDFGGSVPSLIRHLEQYAVGGLKKGLQTYQGSYSHRFNWSLNNYFVSQ